MLNEKTGRRMLAYTARIGDITPITGADNIELVAVQGWHCIAKKGEFQPGDRCVYFEIDSKVPATDWFEFLSSKQYKVKTMKLSKFGVVSQGLAMPVSAFGDIIPDGDYADCTDLLGVTHIMDDTDRVPTPTAGDFNAKGTSMKARHPRLFRTKFARWMMRREWGRRVMVALFGRKKTPPTTWPVGKFPGVSQTDQERVENEPQVLQEGMSWIRTEKCDGSSGTYILARKGRKFEFYVCSRRVRMVDENQDCFHGYNYYWEVARKYDIERKMKAYLNDHPELTFVCWQGEICAPNIQKNPHHLTSTHFYCFHWTDDTGRWDIRHAADIWKSLNMDVVPIEREEYKLPATMEEMKATADGYYDPSVCEGKADCPREGYVYYRVDNPAVSFKNVSIKYLCRNK